MMRDYDEIQKRCKLMVVKDDFVWNNIGDEAVTEYWLMMGPPDGVIQGYLEGNKAELMDFVEDDEVFNDWNKAFDRVVQIAVKIGDLTEDEIQEF